MKRHTRLLLTTVSLGMTSCANFTENLVDSLFDNMLDSVFESDSDRRMDSDTKRMQSGEPLKYYSSEKRLRAAREDRMINDMMRD